jgi:DNA-binding MarR family transcriptional regulator
MRATLSIPVRDSFEPSHSAFRALTSFRVHLLAGMSARQAELRFMQKFGMRLLECRIVGMVGTLGALSLKQICHETDIEKAHASRLVNRLQQRGLIEKFEGRNDLRSISVELTGAGRALYEAIHADAVERNEVWLSVLSEPERLQFRDLVDRLIAQSRVMLDKSLPGAEAPRAPSADDRIAASASPESTDHAPVLLDAELARSLQAALAVALSPEAQSR